MSIRHRLALLWPVCLFLLFSVFLAACGQQAPVSSTSSASPVKLKSISVGLGYIPDIQFAPFYLAQSRGYYKAVGLDVTFHHGIVPDLVGSMVAGKNDFVFAGGDDLLVARDKGVQAIDVGTIFQKYPVSLIVPQDSPIKTLAELKGHTIGIPGQYGSTYVGLLALLYKANLTLADVKIQSIGFTQVAALIGKHVDAVMGYSNNEPLQLKKRGFAVNTFAVSDYQPLVSNGILTTESMYQNQKTMVGSFVQATVKGLKDVIANPADGVEVSKSYVPGMDATQALAVLQATIPAFQGSGPLGYNDATTWASMEKFLVAQKMIKPVVGLEKVYTNDSLSRA